MVLDKKSEDHQCYYISFSRGLPFSHLADTFVQKYKWGTMQTTVALREAF